VPQIMSGEHHFSFHWRNRDIHILSSRKLDVRIFISIIRSEWTQLTMMWRTRKRISINGNNEARHLNYMKCMETAEPKEWEIGCLSPARRSRKIRHGSGKGM
jgi:hypothetical protein